MIKSMLFKNSKTLCVNQPNFFPYIGYFHMISKSDFFVFYDHVQFDKNGWRNRNHFIINEKIKWITVPVLNEKLEKKINETKLFNYKIFYNKFIKTLYQFYRYTPYFNNIISWLESNLPTEANFLSDLNIHLTKKIMLYLGINMKTYSSSNFKNNILDKNDNLINIAKKFDCNHYLTGPSGLNYLDKKKFVDSKINLKIYKLNNHFLSKFKKDRFLSILHLMFNYNVKSIFNK